MLPLDSGRSVSVLWCGQGHKFTCWQDTWNFSLGTSGTGWNVMVNISQHTWQTEAVLEPTGLVEVSRGTWQWSDLAPDNQCKAALSSPQRRSKMMWVILRFEFTLAAGLWAHTLPWHFVLWWTIGKYGCEKVWWQAEGPWHYSYGLCGGRPFALVLLNTSLRSWYTSGIGVEGWPLGPSTAVDARTRCGTWRHLWKQCSDHLVISLLCQEICWLWRCI